MEQAVEQAITECIREDILAAFLQKNRAEAKKVSIYEYDEEKHMRQVLEEGIEIGTQNNILLILESKGLVSPDLRESILSVTDSEHLKALLLKASSVHSVEEFQI